MRLTMIDLFELEQVFIEELSLILDYYITKKEVSKES